MRINIEKNRIEIKLKKEETETERNTRFSEHFVRLASIKADT